MAYANIRDLLKIATVGGDADAERKLSKFILNGVDIVREQSSTLASKFKKLKPIKTPVVRWLEQYDYPTQVTGALSTVTITFSGYLFNAAITADNLKQVVRIGTVLRRPSDGVQMLVSAVDYANLQCTVGAHGNNSLSDDASAITYDIIGESTSDYNTDWQPRAVDRKWRDCSLQIIKEDFEIPWLMRAMAMEQVPDEVAHQLKSLMNVIARKMDRSLLMMEPVYSGGAYVGADKTVQPTVTGILTWLKICNAERAMTNTYVDMSSVAPDPDNLNNLVFHMETDEFANFNTGNWHIACSPVQHQYLSDMFAEDRQFMMADKKVGYGVEVFYSKLGKAFPILRDYHMPNDMIVVVDTNDVGWGYVANDQLRQVPIAQGDNSRVDKRFITCAFYGTVMRKPRQSIGGLYGLPTTYV